MAVDHTEYRPFDADNHYYESVDAFTRHVPLEMQPRVVQWVELGSRRYHLVGGQISHAVVNPTWNPIAKPGALNSYFKGNLDGANPLDMLKDREPLPDHYIGKTARAGVLHDQGLQGVWLFPTLGMLYEELLKNDVEACVAMMTGFNRWLDEDWGYAFDDTIFAAPYLCLGDVDAAAAEVDRVVQAGATVVVMRPASVVTPTATLSPFDPHFDPFWARVNEAGITVVIHAADSGYSTQGYAKRRFSTAGVGAAAYSGPSIGNFSIERAAQDWLIQAVFQRIFDRFPNLRIASVENGSDFLLPTFRKFEQTAKKSFGWFRDHPVDTFKEHVWMNPFWEDDVHEVVELMGGDHVIFGSDWPHIEGLPQPLDYVVELKDFDDETQRKILLDNVTSLNTLRPG